MQKQSVPEQPEGRKQVLASAFYRYHHQTKHTVESLFSGNHRLDWANQPDPFRTYDGAPVIDLDTSIEVSNLNFFETLISFQENLRRSPEDIRSFLERNAEPPSQMSLNRVPSIMAPTARFVSNLLFYSMAISAWKQVVGTDHRWALRVNASSGNLHPTDTHILIRDIDGIEAGAYHYRVDKHQLERRVEKDLVTPLCKALGTSFEPPRLMICLTSIFWREAWKYQSRAFRYCQHDLGHALATVSMAAASLGWTTRILSLFPDGELADALGLSTAEGSRGSDERSSETLSDERPLALVALAPLNESTFPSHEKPNSIFGGTAPAHFAIGAQQSIGTPNVLSKSEVPYSSIQKVYESTVYSTEDWKAAREQIDALQISDEPPPLPSTIVASADAIETEHVLSKASSDCVHDSVHKTIRVRRSAVDMDGETGMTKAHLEYILACATSGFAADFQSCDRYSGTSDGTTSASERISTDGLHLIKLFLYVNRVDGLARGLYYYDRGNQLLVPLLLRDVRELAKQVSCFQDIAADGAFAISMIADFNLGYSLFKDRAYRLAHYEAGFIGQILYLTACALGHDSTGIGCFIDDAINEFLALPEGEEVIYNFTFGKAVIDERLTTLPSYEFDDPAIGR